MAVRSVRSSRGWISPFLKRIAYKKERVAAITATARKLAVIIWHVPTTEEPYKEVKLKPPFKRPEKRVCDKCNGIYRD